MDDEVGSVSTVHCRKLLTLGRGRCGSVDCYRVVGQGGDGVETLHEVAYNWETDYTNSKKTTTTITVPLVSSIIANDAVIAVKSFNNSYNNSKVLYELKVLKSLQSKSVYLQQLLGQYVRRIDDDGGGQQSVLVLEAYLGGSLSHHILHNNYQNFQLNRLHIHCIRNVVSELVSALTVLECMDIIHRDVKTSNCLIDSSGRLKLCDFGSSKVLRREHSVSSSYCVAAGRTNTITGTYHGVAPEVVACAAPPPRDADTDADTIVGYDHSVDYWSLGVLMYELLTGKMPAWIRRPVVRLNKTTRDSDSVREDDAFHSCWPDEHAGSVAREAIHGRVQGVDVIRLNAVSFVDSILGHASRGSGSDGDAALTSRDTTTTRNEIEHSWYIETVDGRFACSRALPELLFDSACRQQLYSSVEEVHLRGAAADLVRCLLTVNPDRRLEALKQKKMKKRRSSMRSRLVEEGEEGDDDDNGRWSSAVRGHPFFDDISWGAIDCGASPPSLVDYDRRLGFTELVSAAEDDPDGLISPESQLLFEGF